MEHAASSAQLNLARKFTLQVEFTASFTARCSLEINPQKPDWVNAPRRGDDGFRDASLTCNNVAGSTFAPCTFGETPEQLTGCRFACSSKLNTLNAHQRGKHWSTAEHPLASNCAQKYKSTDIVRGNQTIFALEPKLSSMMLFVWAFMVARSPAWTSTAPLQIARSVKNLRQSALSA